MVQAGLGKNKDLMSKINSQNKRCEVRFKWYNACPACAKL
jgi:hypothetical protein